MESFELRRNFCFCNRTVGYIFLAVALITTSSIASISWSDDSTHMAEESCERSNSEIANELQSKMGDFRVRFERETQYRIDDVRVFGHSASASKASKGIRSAGRCRPDVVLISTKLNSGELHSKVFLSEVTRTNLELKLTEYSKMLVIDIKLQEEKFQKQARSLSLETAHFKPRYAPGRSAGFEVSKGTSIWVQANELFEKRNHSFYKGSSFHQGYLRFFLRADTDSLNPKSEPSTRVTVLADLSSSEYLAGNENSRTSVVVRFCGFEIKWVPTSEDQKNERSILVKFNYLDLSYANSHQISPSIQVFSNLFLHLTRWDKDSAQELRLKFKNSDRKFSEIEPTVGIQGGLLYQEKLGLDISGEASVDYATAAVSFLYRAQPNVSLKVGGAYYLTTFDSVRKNETSTERFVVQDQLLNEGWNARGSIVVGF